MHLLVCSRCPRNCLMIWGLELRIIVPKIVIMRAGFGNNRTAFVQNPGENGVAGSEEEGHQEKKGWFKTKSEQERSCAKASMFIELMQNERPDQD